MNIFSRSVIGKGFVSLFLVAGLFLTSNSASAATYYVDAAATGTGTGVDQLNAFTTIQAGIDAATQADDIVEVAAGTYSETAPNKTVNGATYTFGLFFGVDGVTLRGNGSVIVTTNATNNFGPSGIFVAANNVTIDGITVNANVGSTNKTIEVIGDAFTLKNSKLTETEGALYISDFTADSKVNTYTIDNNVFEAGSSITIASGAGSSTVAMPAARLITNNTFNGTSNNYARISFSGNGGQPWFVYPVGGATITGNTFSADNKWNIRARGGYDNSQFDWSSYWNANTFNSAAIALSDLGTFTPRDYSYTPYSNVRSIGSDLDWTIVNASSSDTVLLKGGLTSAITTSLNKPLTIKGETGAKINTSGGNQLFNIVSSDVTIDGVEINKTDKTTQQIIGVQSGDNISIKNNTIHGQFVIGEGDVSRAMVVSGGLTGLNIEGNTIHSLRQPAYVTGTTTGTVSNNFVYGTKGWVLEGGDLTFTGNTWGTSTQSNVVDIAILGTVPEVFYTNIMSMSAANNFAAIEDQRATPRKLSVIYVDAAFGGVSDGLYATPYKTVNDAMSSGKLVDGGKIVVAAGMYNENLTVSQAMTISGPNSDINPVTGVRSPEAIITGQILIATSSVSVKGMSVTNPTWSGVSIKGIHVFSAGPTVSDISITNNLIDTINNTNNKGSYGVMIQGDVDGVTIDSNKINNIGSAGWARGIEVTPTCASSIVPKNVVINNNSVTNVTAVSGDAFNFSLDACSSPLIIADASEVSFDKNTFDAVKIKNLDPTNPLDVRKNYWGSAAPDFTTQATGTLTFDPWYIDAPMTTLYAAPVPVTPTPTPTPSTGGGLLPITFTSAAGTGQVLGASTGQVVPVGQVLGASSFKFNMNLRYGMRNDDVTELHKFLIANGYLKISAPTGWFGPLTKAAVIKWQAANGIPATGFFGPISRAFINK